MPSLPHPNNGQLKTMWPQAPIRSPQLLAAKRGDAQRALGAEGGLAGAPDQQAMIIAPDRWSSYDGFVGRSSRRAASRKWDWVRMKSINARNGPGTWRRLG
jgi:hypothetical protein